MLNKLIQTTTVTFLFLFPLFSLPVTPDSYEYNKMTLLVLTALVLLFLFSLKIIREKRLVVVKDSFSLPLFFLTGIVLISTLFQSPNLAVALTTPLSTTTIIAGFLFYILLVNILYELEKSASPLNPTSLLNILLLDAVLLSFYVVAMYTGVLPKSLFTPAGTLLSCTMFLSIMAVYLIAWLVLYFLNSKEAIPKETISETDRPAITSDCAKIRYLEEDIRNLDRVGVSEKFVSEGLQTVLFYTLALLLIGGATILLSIHLFSDQKPIILPLSFGWMIFLEILKSPISLLLGVGPTNFLTAFSLAKPLGFNTTLLWNVIFTSSSSFLLNLATETGILTSFLYIMILAKSIKLLKINIAPQSYHSPSESAQLISAPPPPSDISTYQSTSETANYLPITLTLLTALLLQMFFPSSMSLFILTIILLAFAAKKKVAAEINLSRLGKTTYLPLLFLLILIMVTSYFAGRAYLAEVFFKNSLEALLNNQGREAYNFQRRAIELNPYLDRYHLAFSQTNLALANALAAKRQLNEEDKQKIPHLVQQAIDHARMAVVLYRTNVVNWDNLGRTYASLINFASGAQDWAISSYQQKLLLDPVNPSNYLVLGGLYLSLERYPEAESHFRQALALKPDFANGHYNLSLALRQQKKYQEAYRELQTTKVLLSTNSPDAQRIEQELADLAELLPSLEATPSPQPQTPTEPQTLEEIEPTSAPLLNLPTPLVTISLPQPPITP